MITIKKSIIRIYWSAFFSCLGLRFGVRSSLITDRAFRIKFLIPVNKLCYFFSLVSFAKLIEVLSLFHVISNWTSYQRLRLIFLVISFDIIGQNLLDFVNMKTISNSGEVLHSREKTESHKYSWNFLAVSILIALFT